jgi:hypothetical protein
MAPRAIDEAVLIDSLDDEWRTPLQIRTRLGLRQLWSIRIANALERLADSDQIDRRLQVTDVRKRYGDYLTIRHYRRRPLQG